jgi:hypothetical protein
MTRDWKKSLMGSTTMPLGTGGGFNFALGGHHYGHGHYHADGSYCEHDHGAEQHIHDDHCGHDHAPGESCDAGDKKKKK